MQAAQRGAAEAADRVSGRAGLVNLHVINTPLAAFGLMSREMQRASTNVDARQRVSDTGVEAASRGKMRRTQLQAAQNDQQQCRSNCNGACLITPKDNTE